MFFFYDDNVPGAWTPAQLTTILWESYAIPSTDTGTSITAIAGAVTNVADLSGNGNDTPQATPALRPTTDASTLNGNNILDFDGSDILDIPSGVFGVANGANTVFALSKRTVDAGQQLIYTLQEGANFRTVLRYNDPGQVSWRSSSGGGDIFAFGVTTTDFNIINGSYDGGTAQELYINGGLIGTNAGGVLEPNIDQGAIGGGVTLVRLTGSIAEIIIAPSLLSTEDREKVEGYLAWKWSI